MTEAASCTKQESEQAVPERAVKPERLAGWTCCDRLSFVSLSTSATLLIIQLSCMFGAGGICAAAAAQSRYRPRLARAGATGPRPASA